MKYSNRRSRRGDRQSPLTKSHPTSLTSTRPSPAGPTTLAKDIPIFALGLSVRAYNAVARAGIKTVGQLAALGPDGVMAVRSVGTLVAEEIATKLTDYGLPLSASAPDKPASEPALVADEAPVSSLVAVQSPIKALGLSNRTYNALTRAGIRTIGKRAAISLGEGVFSLAEWETARARQGRPVLPVCPRPWVEVSTFHDRLLESVMVARARLHLLVGLGAAERLPSGTYRLRAAMASEAAAGQNAHIMIGVCS